MTSAICNVVSEYMPHDYRSGIYTGAAGGAFVALYVLSYLDRLSNSEPKGKEGEVCGKEIVLIAKGAFVTVCTVTGGVIGFIPYIKNA